LHRSGRPLLNAGVAIHSLRAVGPSSVAKLRDLASQMNDGPIHIHVSEQIQEVEQCVAALGARPVEWLAGEGMLDARWQLIHATHTVTSEIDSVARSGASVVICPSTEANLGDGVCDLPGWLASSTPMSIGSDSHVTRDWREELRLLEYGQRLQKQQRNISASPQIGLPSTAERLWMRTQSGGAAAAGFKQWGLTIGARADLLVMDKHDANLIAVPNANQLDALVFSSPSGPWRDVMVAGKWVVRAHHHVGAEKIANRFGEAMRMLWADSI
jgi:formimidoylglutamate deiminase